MTKIESDSAWHLDKKIPIGLFLMIIAQTITLVYVGTTWKSDVDNRISNLEHRTDSSDTNNNRLTVLETQYVYIQDTLRRIEGKLDTPKDKK